MRSNYVRIISGATSLAVITTLIGFSTFAAAASGGPTIVLSSTTTSPTTATSIPVTAVFSAPVTGFGSTGITATNGTVTNFSGSGANYSFNLNPSAQGTTSVMIPADIASSTDASSTGNQVSNTLSFLFSTATTTPTLPIISGVSATTTSSGATIMWTTNVATEGKIMYGSTASYTASSTMESSFGTSHTATISGLNPSTTYHYQITSMDQSSNVATTSDATFATIASTTAPTAPMISNISALSTGTSTATITWTTDVAASSQVMYGTSASYGSSNAMNSTPTTSHSVTLSNLNEAVLYHFAVISADSTGTTTSADNQFVTQSTASSTPLTVTGVDTVQSVATAGGGFANGWQWTMHLTVPDNENAFRMLFSDFLMANSSTTFPAAGNIEIFSAQSSNASSSSSAIVSTGNNQWSGWLDLNGDTGTTTAGRQIDVTIETQIPVGTPAGSYSTNYAAESVPSTATSTTQ